MKERILHLLVFKFRLKFLLHKYPNSFIWTFKNPLNVQNRDGSKSKCVINYFDAKKRIAEIITNFEDGRPISKCNFSNVPLKYISL